MESGPRAVSARCRTPADHDALSHVSRWPCALRLTCPGLPPLPRGDSSTAVPPARDRRLPAAEGALTERYLGGRTEVKATPASTHAASAAHTAMPPRQRKADPPNRCFSSTSGPAPNGSGIRSAGPRRTSVSLSALPDEPRFQVPQVAGRDCRAPAGPAADPSRPVEAAAAPDPDPGQRAARCRLEGVRHVHRHGAGHGHHVQQPRRVVGRDPQHVVDAAAQEVRRAGDLGAGPEPAAGRRCGQLRRTDALGSTPRRAASPWRTRRPARAARGWCAPR